MPLVFAFGSNMDPEQMRRRCPSAVFRSVNEIKDHRLSFVGFSNGWGGAVATIEPAPAHIRTRVVGILWRVSAEDLAILDGFEGCPNVYRRVKCKLSDGPHCWVYAHNRPVRGQPSKAYVAAIRRGWKFADRDPTLLRSAIRRCGGLAPEFAAGRLARRRSADVRARRHVEARDPLRAWNEQEIDEILAALDRADRRAARRAEARDIIEGCGRPEQLGWWQDEPDDDGRHCAA